MSTAVLFLDVDGVLNNEGVFSDRRFGPLPLDHQCITRLHKVVTDTNCEIVLSSAWRDGDWTERKLEACFVFDVFAGLGKDYVCCRHADGPNGSRCVEAV